MQLAKLILIVLTIGLQFNLSEGSNTQFHDASSITNSIIRLNQDKKKKCYLEVINSQNGPIMKDIKRHKRSRYSKILDESNFSGSAVLNDNARPSSAQMKKTEKKKNKHKKKKEEDEELLDRNSTIINTSTVGSNNVTEEVAPPAKQPLPTNNKKYNKIKPGKKKIRFSSDAERLKPLQTIFKSRTFEDLKSGYYNGQLDDYDDYFSHDNNYKREKKDVSQNIPKLFVFRGQIPQPQFVEDTYDNIKMELPIINISKRETDSNPLPQSNDCETQVICNPEKPSVVLDSAAPRSIQHIDREIVEEIIQVDIPVRTETVTCATTTCPVKTTTCYELPEFRFPVAELHS